MRCFQRERFAEMDTPWKALAPVDAGRQYLALLSYLPLRSYRKIPQFFLYSFQIQAQLRQTTGVIGYSLRARPLSRKFWTLSVWENERALMDFVARIPHAESMKALAAHMGTTKFARWSMPGSEFPPH